jgi:hypothetical protein
VSAKRVLLSAFGPQEPRADWPAGKTVASRTAASGFDRMHSSVWVMVVDLTIPHPNFSESWDQALTAVSLASPLLMEPLSEAVPDCGM